MISLEREVTASRGEFLHGLRSAFPGCVAEISEHVRINGDLATMEILISPLPDRRIAVLRLPNMRVQIRFTHGTHQEQQAMLARLDLAMQRGGG
jgi:hypothetical protein